MTLPGYGWVEALDSCARRLGGHAEVWRLPATRTPTLPALTLRLGSAWLAIESRVRVSSSTLPGLLDLNPELPPGLKLAVAAHTSAPRLQAEFSLGLPEDLESLLAWIQRSFAATLDDVRRGRRPGLPQPIPGTATGASLEELLAETRRDWSPWDMAGAALDLGDSEGAIPARVRRRAGGELELRLDVHDGQALTGLALEAVVLLLTRVCGQVAFIRPGRHAENGTRTLFLESLLRPSAGARELDHALTALTAAGRISLREVQVLATSPIAAGRYLFLSTAPAVDRVTQH